MKKATLFVLMFVVIVSLVSCSFTPAVVNVTLTCTKVKCGFSIINPGQRPTRFDALLKMEEMGAVVGETRDYMNTSAERHRAWYIQFTEVFHTTGELQGGEVRNFSVDLPQTRGQTLVKLEVVTPPANRLSVDHGDYFVYSIIANPMPTDRLIENSLICINGTIQATTSVSFGLGQKDMALYVDESMDKPIATFTVQEGQTMSIEIPIPEGTRLVELDVYGHSDTWSGTTFEEPHTERVYCLP